MTKVLAAFEAYERRAAQTEELEQSARVTQQLTAHPPAYSAVLVLMVVVTLLAARWLYALITLLVW